MRKSIRMLSLALAVLMLASAYIPVTAAGSDALDALMQGAALPETYTLSVQPEPDVSSGLRVTKVIPVYYQDLGGESAHVVLTLSLLNGAQLETEYETRAERYSQLVKNSLYASGKIDNETAAAELNRSLSQLFRSETLSPRLISIEVTSPYYETMTIGSASDMVMKLQMKLIELGFLNDVADGQFGSNTAEGVKALQSHVRALELDMMKKMGETDAAPTTELNGIADAKLVAYFFSDQFSMASATISQGDSGPAVTRLQNRLIKLGYMAGTADGDYGLSTVRGISQFQRYNGLPEDGVATHELQRLIYSDDAKLPAYRALWLGSRGDDVRNLQERLKQLGFMAGEIDGTYGESTVKAVKKLQEYCQDIETKKLTHKAMPTDSSIELPEPEEQAAVAPRAVEPVDSDIPPAIVPEIVNDEPEDELLDPVPGVENGDFGAADEQVLTSQNPLDWIWTSLFGMIDQVAYAEGSGLPIAEVDGIADPALQELFFADDFPALPQAMTPGMTGLDVERMQRKLCDLEYLYSNPDGNYGDGTMLAVIEFQTRNGLSPSGHAGDDTLRLLFSGECERVLKPFLLKVSIEKQRVYVYAPDANGEYTRIVRQMKCSTGLPSTPTPKGTFQAGTAPGQRWHYFKKFTCWAQYAYYIEGDIMFHSVLYNEMGGHVRQSSVDNLGYKASHGCVRLQVEDAKWIWTNCPKNTKVVIY